jgi:prolipoprotein diacylglyceryl transferase
MTTTVIAYFPSPPRGVWHIWLVPIRAYALFIIIGIVAALLIGDRRWVARGGERGVIYDIALWAVPFGLIGGRLYHLATDWRTYFGEGGAGLLAALRIWDGGLGIWGAVALGGVGAWIACRRRGIPLPAFADAIAPGIVLAQAIGRLGNYFNQELFGRETTMPWGLEIFYRRDPAGFVDVHSLDGVSTGQLAMVVQPTFLYELLWNLLVFAVLIYLDRRFTIGHGRLFALYVAGYCIGRFCVELLRDDAATHIAGIRINSFTATFVFIGAVVYLILAPKGREDPATLSGSAADRLVPDSVEEAPTVSSPSVGPVAATARAAAGSTESTAPVAAAAAHTETAELTALDGPEAAAVVEEADAAELDALEVEVTEAHDQTTPGETAGDVEGSEAVSVEGEEIEGADVAGAGETAGDVEGSEAVSVEGEEIEAVDVAGAGETAGDVEDSEAVSVEGEETEAADVAGAGETAGDVEDSEAVSAEGEETEEAAVPDTESPAPKAAEAVELTESAGDESTSAEELVSSLNPEPTDSTATRWGSRLRRLNPRSRR